MAALRLNLLGGFELLSGGGVPLSLPPKKAKALLAYLALGGPRPQARDKLAALLWADSTDAQARTSLRQALSAIRKGLGESDCIQADTQAVAARPETLEVDAQLFEQLVGEGAEASLWRAVELYAGDLLDGFSVDAPGFEAWLATERERLRRLAVEAMARLADEHAERGQIERAIAAATRLVALDPLHEKAHRALMRLYLKQDRQAAALKQYRLCREILRRELAVSPEPETDRLYREILQQRRADAAVGDAAPAVEEAAVEEAPSAQPDAPGAQLREAVVMVAEIAGLSEAAAADDAEAVHALLGRYRSRTDVIVRQYGGSPASRIGARLVAVFGAPMAHGNDTERCVRAALAIGRAVADLDGGPSAPLRARIGIASGLVLAEQQGAALFVTGEPLGLATRIMEAGAPGEVWVAGRVRDALATRLDARCLADARIESMHRPIEVWHVRGCGEAEHSRAPPLVGRQTELHQLAAIAAACVAARRGHVVLVRGEAGIGKSRLIQELERLADAQGLRCHKALVFDVTGEGAEDPVLQLLKSLLGLRGTDAGVWRAVVDDASVEAALDEPQRIVLRPTLGAPQPAELVGLYEAMDAEARQRATQGLLCSLVQWAGARSPLLLLVEDIHWAARETLGHLAALAAGTRSCALVLVLTTRAETDPIDAAWRAAARGACFTAIDLAPLDEAEAREMAAHYPCADEALVRSCIERAQGNPLFLDQLLRSVEAGHGPLPGSVQSIVLARMDRLAPADREALQAAAVLGQQFSLPALRHLAGAADEACARLVEQALIRPEGEGFLFIHALVQEGVYASILKSRKRALHARAAQWYAPHDLALHAEHLELAADPGAARAYVEAARAQAQKYHHERALRLAERGAALAVDERLKFEATALRGRLLLDLGRVEEAVAAYRAASALASSGAHQRRALTGLAAALRICDRHREALAALDQALAIEGDEPAVGELAEIHLLRGNLYFPLGESAACLAEHERARAYAARSGSPQLEARALSGLGDAYYQRGQMLTADGYFDRCVTLCEQHGIRNVEAVNLAMRAATRLNRNELAAALADSCAAAQLASQIGDLRAQLLAENLWAACLAYAADWQGAVRHGELALDIARRLGARRFEAEMFMYLGIARWQLEGPAQGERLLDRSHALCMETGAAAYFGPPILAALAAVTADPARRRAALAEGEALLAGGCVSHCHLLFYQYAIELDLELGDWQEVERHAAALEGYARIEPTPWTDFLVRRACALARAGQGGRDAALVAALESLAEEARRTGFKWQLGKLEEALQRLAEAS